MAAYIKSQVVLVWASIHGACVNSIQEFLEKLKADIYAKTLLIFSELELYIPFSTKHTE